MYPIQFTVEVPVKAYSFVGNYFLSRNNLILENESIKKKVLYYKSKLQKLSAIEMENKALKDLLNFYEEKKESMLIAKIIKVDTDFFSNEITINRGKDKGVNVGQPVIDGNGLMGSIINIAKFNSTVLLLSDPRSLIPVESVRNGLRGIAKGLGRDGTLELQYVSNTADVKIGDKFVTSGLGEKYPSGYPVAEVIDIVNDVNLPFSKIILKPFAGLNDSKLLLIVER